MTNQIRQAVANDASILATIIRRSFADVAVRFRLTVKNCPTHPSHCTLQSICDARKKGIQFFIQENDGRPCGCVAVEDAGGGVLYLERLAVLPDQRRKGYGRRLVEHVCQAAQSAGRNRIEIAIIAAHSELRNWYQQLGFYPLRTASFDHLPFEVLFMALDIPTSRKAAGPRGKSAQILGRIT